MSTRKNRKTSQSTGTTFGAHLKELRTRLFLVALVFLVLSLLAYNYRDLLVQLVLHPIGNQKLVYLTPAGGFSFIFSVTMYASLVVSMPFLVYQAYQFVKPALPARAKQYSLAVLLAATTLMIGGVLFGYFIAVPSALQFLTNFAGGFVVPNLTADSYLNFFMAYVAGLGLLFQLPLLLLFWNWISPIKPGGLLSSQRYVIAGSFIVAAIITPTPDVFNQTLVAGPIILIYQLGVIAVFTMNRRAKRKNTATIQNTNSEATAAVIRDSPRVASVETQPQVMSQRTTRGAPRLIAPPDRRSRPKPDTRRSVDGISSLSRGRSQRNSVDLRAKIV